MKMKRKSTDPTYLKRVVDRDFRCISVNDDILNNRVMIMKRYETDLNHMIKLIIK